MAELLRIADGGTVSNAIDVDKYLGGRVIVHSPGTLSGTSTVKVSPYPVEDSVAGDYQALRASERNTPADVTLTAAKAQVVEVLGGSMLVESGTGPSGATEDYLVTGQFRKR